MKIKNIQALRQAAERSFLSLNTDWFECFFKTILNKIERDELHEEGFIKNNSVYNAQQSKEIK